MGEKAARTRSERFLSLVGAAAKPRDTMPMVLPNKALKLFAITGSIC